MKELTIEYPIKVEGKSVFATVKQSLMSTDRFEVTFHFAKRSSVLGTGQVIAGNLPDLVNSVRTVLEKYFIQVSR